jgi:predicted enzyme related to lactoylglutathione lyase
MTVRPRENVIIAVDAAALTKWFVEVLDFKIVRQELEHYTYYNLQNEAGVLIGIADAKQMGVEPHEEKKNATTLMQFEVDDVEAFFQHLRSNGGVVTFGPSFDEGYGFYYGGFADPEGNPYWVVDKNCP